SVRLNGTRRTMTAATKKEAQRKVTDLVKRKHRSELPVGSRRTLEWLVTEFQKTKDHKAEATQFYYRHWSRDWIVPKLGTLTLKRLDTREGARSLLQDFVNECSGPLGAKSVKHVRDVLRAVLRFGIDAGYLTFDATKKLELPDIDSRYRYSILEEGEFITFQEVAHDHPLRAAYVLMLALGLRPGEVMG